MQTPVHFEIVDNRAYFRPTGILSLDGAVALVDEAIACSRSKRVRQLLTNLLGVDGFPIPTIVERYLFIENWASLAGGALQLAMVVAAKHIDRNKFGVVVAANRGLLSDVFAAEADAVAWLDKVAVE